MNNITEEIIDYESGELDEHEIVALFQKLWDTGSINYLQGIYQRQMQALIDAGMIQTEKDE